NVLALVWIKKFDPLYQSMDFPMPFDPYIPLIFVHSFLVSLLAVLDLEAEHLLFCFQVPTWFTFPPSIIIFILRILPTCVRPFLLPVSFVLQSNCHSFIYFMYRKIIYY